MTPWFTCLTWLTFLKNKKHDAHIPKTGKPTNFWLKHKSSHWYLQKISPKDNLQRYLQKISPKDISKSPRRKLGVPLEPPLDDPPLLKHLLEPPPSRFFQQILGATKFVFTSFQVRNYMDVSSENRRFFSPQSIHGLIGFSMMFTIHFGVFPLWLETAMRIMVDPWDLFIDFLLVTEFGTTRQKKQLSISLLMTARCLWLVHQSFEWRWCFTAAIFKVQQSYGSHLLFCILHDSCENWKDAVTYSRHIGWIYLYDSISWNPIQPI